MTGIQNSLGSTIDQRFKIRTERLELQNQVEDLKREEKALDEAILTLLNEAGLTKASGLIATTSISPTTVATVKDWDKLYEFIQTNGHFHLLQRRVSDVAYREALGIYGEVPGVEPTTLTKLSLTKVTK